MCGRYNFTVEQSEEIREMLEKLNAKIRGKIFNTGEIFPTHQVPVLVGEENQASPVLSIWGFPRFDKKGVIINARSETVFEKKTFRDSVINRRCVIPSTGFYEWDSEKRKFLFKLQDADALYMAGIYTMYQGEMRFVILTTQANESMIDVHNRMPLIIYRHEIETWIMDDKVTGDILNRIPPLLIREQV